MKNLILMGIMFLMTSCLTLNLKDLKPYPKIETLLPTLEPMIDEYSFESAYPTGYNAGYQTTIEQVNDKEVVVNSGFKPDFSRKQDAITLFNREVKENITNPYGDVKGSIVCKIAGESSVLGGYGWAVLSGFTFFIPNLLGMPIGNYHTSLDLDVEIYNTSNKLIGSYNAIGNSKIWCAMYYGYSHGSAYRKSNIDAFKLAMKDIKSQIEKDSERLIKELN